MASYTAFARETIELARQYFWLVLYHNASTSMQPHILLLLACLIEFQVGWLSLAFSVSNSVYAAVSLSTPSVSSVQSVLTVTLQEPIMGLAKKAYRKYIEFITPRGYKRHIIQSSPASEKNRHEPGQVLQPPFEEKAYSPSPESISDENEAASDTDSPLSPELNAYTPSHDIGLSQEDADRIYELFTALNAHQRLKKSVTPVSSANSSPRSRPPSPVQSYSLPRVHGCKPYIQKPVTLEPIQEENSHRGFFSSGYFSAFNLGSPSFIARRKSRPSENKAADNASLSNIPRSKHSIKSVRSIHNPRFVRNLPKSRGRHVLSGDIPPTRRCSTL